MLLRLTCQQCGGITSVDVLADWKFGDEVPVDWVYYKGYWYHNFCLYIRHLRGLDGWLNTGDGNEETIRPEDTPKK